MKLNFFLDIDGTLLPFGKEVPRSALEILEYARSLGHKIFLSTGRSVPELPDAIKHIQFDGGVYSAGANVIVGEKTIYDRVFNKREKELIKTAIENLKLEVLLQTDKGTYLTPSSCDYFKESQLKYIGRVIDIPNCVVTEPLPLDDLDIRKLLFLSRTGEVDKVKEALKGSFVVVNNTVGLPEEYMAEIVLPGISKATGIEAVINYLGESRESTVAIGDGANDIEMVEYASLGIAMGNSSQDLKSVADYISKDIEQDGLKDAISYALTR